MSVQTTGETDTEHDRWRKLFSIASGLAQQHGQPVLAVRYASRWLYQTGGRISDNELVVTWTVADAEIVRHQLRLSRDRVLPAAPRVRHGKTTAAGSGGIPEPRGQYGSEQSH